MSTALDGVSAVTSSRAELKSLDKRYKGAWTRFWAPACRGGVAMATRGTERSVLMAHYECLQSSKQGRMKKIEASCLFGGGGLRLPTKALKISFKAGIELEGYLVLKVIQLTVCVDLSENYIYMLLDVI